MPAENLHIKEAVCIHTKKVYDSCKDKDCMEDLRVYPTRCSQAVIDRAINVKCRRVELLWVYIDVEPVNFNHGFYTVDVKYFYKVTGDAFTGLGKPQEFHGLATYDKRVILFGSEGNAKIFSSTMSPNSLDEQQMMRTNMPVAVVEVVDPICLGMKLVEVHDCPRGGDHDVHDLPNVICNCFDDDLVLGDSEKRVYVTLGQFSIIKLERDSQLLIPAYDFCMPEKECIGSNEENPCLLFRRIEFPVDEFFPPQRDDFFEDGRRDHDRDRDRR
jgi:hypothetical protein